jgi:hypothetical protein
MDSLIKCPECGRIQESVEISLIPSSNKYIDGRSLAKVKCECGEEFSFSIYWNYTNSLGEG